MDSTTNADTILAILKERDTLVKRDVIESALGDSTVGPKNAEWAAKHLRSETLLSKEELSLYERYTKLENSGALQPILREPSLGATRPFLETDIQSAIDSLEASTVTIKQQSHVLSLQCEAVKKKLRREGSLDQDRSRDIARLRKKHESGKQNATVLANELADNLEDSFRSEMDNVGIESKRILTSLSARLKHDDKALATMESLMAETKSNGNDASTLKRAAYLSGMLADYSAEEIHYRLDRLYLEAIQAKGLDRSPAAEIETVTALVEELESLYPEIEILAEMSTRQQFHEPILREIHHEHSQLRAASQTRLEQILDVLIDMTVSKEALTTQLAGRESSCELLEQIATLHQTETASHLVAQPSSRRESLRRRSLLPGSNTGSNIGNTRTPASLPEQPSLENLLRRIGVSPDSVLKPRVEDGGAPGLFDKRIQMLETLRHLENSGEISLVTHLMQSDHASQLLTSSLRSNSRFETTLQDPRLEEALLGLEAELASLKKGVQGLDINLLHQRDKSQVKFLERWH
ncbi:hypothetical protein N7478_002626 [Penicillium angulare]|uniref:uncharacterized protein n=1 Tax=Penicillium angulare TaxID=116970 RepID=UPI0025403EB8|nr:uncharacterized protein N7478_002626 [Penicillium angulare]KAJ5286940.1 hypothetical protein N7478_002626 [Penicillium angulare]